MYIFLSSKINIFGKQIFAWNIMPFSGNNMQSNESLPEGMKSMIKGVNKNVIEISDTGSDLFERAILFVRPDNADRSHEHLRRRACEFVSGLKLRPWFYPGGKLFVACAKLAAAAIAGAGVAVMILR